MTGRTSPDRARASAALHELKTAASATASRRIMPRVAPSANRIENSDCRYRTRAATNIEKFNNAMHSNPEAAANSNDTEERVAIARCSERLIASIV